MQLNWNYSQKLQEYSKIISCAIFQIVCWIFFSDMNCHVAGEKPRLTGSLNTGLLVRPHVRNIGYTTLCFWHLRNLSECTYLPKVTLATRYLVSAPTHFPSNMKTTYPTCLALTALKAKTYLLQVNLSFCFGWRDQSADLVVFGA